MDKTAAAAILTEELRFFESIKLDLLKTCPGQFALIKGHTLAGTFTTLEEAYQQGLKQFGDVPFLIKQILPEEPVHYIPLLARHFVRANI